MKGAYYIAASYDMLYSPDFVSKVVETLEKPENKKYGSATCKLMRWEFSEKNLNLEKSKSNCIDSVGLGLTKGHYFFDHGQGQEDQGQFDQLKEVFGTSGALGIFKKEALADIAYKNKDHTEFFDELIHYKNDIDLAYRLQWAGWPCLFISNAKVWHDRQAESEGKNKSMLLNILKSRKDKANWVKENSFFGHLVVLAKNYRNRGFSLKVRIKTNLMNFFKLCYICVFERLLFQQYKKLKERSTEITNKRNAMLIRQKPSELESLMI